jgi:hypothetical protein
VTDAGPALHVDRTITAYKRSADSVLRQLPVQLPGQMKHHDPARPIAAYRVGAPTTPGPMAVVHAIELANVPSALRAPQ